MARVLALDVGRARIGVALSDRDGRMAMPVETVRRTTKDGVKNHADFRRICEIVAENQVSRIVVGLPKDLKGNDSASVRDARYFARGLEVGLTRAGLNAPIEFYDERLTTVIATNALQAAGVNAKRGRAVVDQAAAVAILQGWLDGQAAGRG